MATFDIRLFGAIEIRRDGLLLTDFRSQKALVLLAYLICENRPVMRDYLAGLAWPEMAQSQALGLLRRSLHDLNSQLPGCLAIDRRTVHFSPTTLTTVDLQTFTTLMAANNVDGWTTAADCYRAPFLQGIYVDDAPELENWLLRAQEHWQQAATQALEELIQHHTASSAYARALEYVQQLLALAPWREEAQRQTMLLLARTGQVSAALAQYERCRQILQTELAVEPAPATERLYTRIKAIAHLPPANLPVATTPFIGRAAELTDLVRLLANRSSRLITLLGPGGIGKTRLALTVARQVITEQQRVFLHGVHFVSLAGTDTAPQFISTLAQALALTLQPQSPAADQICHYLRDKELLLVLDNFEQVVEGASIAFVTKLLQTAPDVKLLITARIRLNLQGEQLYWLQGLHFPVAQANHGPLPLADLGQYSGMQLFLEAAGRVQPDYHLTQENAGAIAAICQLVQGMPLAIELAAAWSSILSPAEIATEISRNLDFLASEMYDLPLRQRSMRAVFDTSWCLLTPAEQTMFQQLSVFCGGFTLEAAQAVAGATLPLLARLQQHSFIHYQSNQERYDIHELLRQYGAEQLAQNQAEAENTYVRYSVFFCGMLVQLGAESKTSRQESALHTAEIENKNLHTAWLWAVRYHRFDLAGPALDGLLLNNEWVGRYDEGAEICELAITYLSTSVLPNAIQLRSKLLTWQGIFVRYQGDPLRAHQLLYAGLDLLEALKLAGSDTRADDAFLKLRLGKFAERMQRKQALAYFTESLALYQQLDDAWGSAYALAALGFMALEGENFANASMHYRESLRLFQIVGDARSSLYVLNQLAISLTFENKLAEATACTDEAERIVSQIKEPLLVADTLAHKGIVTWFSAKIEAAYSCFMHSLTIYEKLGDCHTLPNAHLLLSEVLLHLGRVDECQAQVQKAQALVNRSGDYFYLGWALMMSGMASVFTKEYIQAEKQLMRSIELFSESGQNRRISECWSILGLIAVCSNDLSRARHSLRNALHILQNSGYLPSVLLALEVTAFYLIHQKAIIEATELDALTSDYDAFTCSKWVNIVIIQPVQLATATLSQTSVASAQARGRTTNPWTTAMGLLTQFTAT